MTNAAIDTVARLKAEARLWPRGHRYEDFEIGRHFVHHWGRTVTEADNTLFSTLTLHYNPHYTNAAFARAHGHPDSPVNPLLVFNTVFGLSVEDLSEGGGPFLGVDELSYLAPVYPGETIRTEIWSLEPGRAAFRCRAVERDIVILNNGIFEFAAG